jgi:hypothetical protein
LQIPLLKEGLSSNFPTLQIPLKEELSSNFLTLQIPLKDWLASNFLTLRIPLKEGLRGESRLKDRVTFQISVLSQKG